MDKQPSVIDYKIVLETSAIDDVIKKAEKLVGLLKEAKSLSDELALGNIEIGMSLGKWEA